jgi:hypothetical protein
MSIEGELRQMAHDAAARAKGRASRLSEEYAEAEKSLSALKTKLDFENFAEDRLVNFKVKIGTDYQCPICWIDDKGRFPLRPAYTDDKLAVLRCDKGHSLPID